MRKEKVKTIDCFALEIGKYLAKLLLDLTLVTVFLWKTLCESHYTSICENIHYQRQTEYPCDTAQSRTDNVSQVQNPKEFAFEAYSGHSISQSRTLKCLLGFCHEVTEWTLRENKRGLPLRL